MSAPPGSCPPVKRKEREEAEGHRAGALALCLVVRWRWECGMDIRVCRKVLMRRQPLFLKAPPQASALQPASLSQLGSRGCRSNPAPSDTLRTADTAETQGGILGVCTTPQTRRRVPWFQRQHVTTEEAADPWDRQRLSTPSSGCGGKLPPSSIMWSYGLGSGGWTKPPSPSLPSLWGPSHTQLCSLIP